MSQPQSQSQSQSSSFGVPSFFACVQYEQARRELQALRSSMENVLDKRSARSWAEDFGRIMVRRVFSCLVPVLLIACRTICRFMPTLPASTFPATAMWVTW